MAQVRTKKKEFLSQIERIVPWGEWLTLIRPCYYKGERGNKPYDLERMLRIYLLPKPFDTGELLARIRAMLRRRESYVPAVLSYGDISLNPDNCELCGNGEHVAFSKLEYRLMKVLMLNQGVYLSSEALLSKVWGYDTEAELGSVWVYISYLRKRLSALGSKVEIRAKRNVGYSLETKI